MTIGEKIRDRRIAQSMTQTELAEKLNTTKQTIGKYEKGIVTNIPLNRVVELAAALDCTPEYLTGWEEKTSPATMTEDEYDEELREVLEEMKNRPDMRMLFRLAKGAKAEDVRQAVKIIEALRAEDS